MSQDQRLYGNGHGPGVGHGPTSGPGGRIANRGRGMQQPPLGYFSKSGLPSGPRAGYNPPPRGYSTPPGPPGQYSKGNIQSGYGHPPPHQRYASVDDHRYNQESPYPSMSGPHPRQDRIFSDNPNQTSQQQPVRPGVGRRRPLGGGENQEDQQGHNGLDRRQSATESVKSFSEELSPRKQTMINTSPTILEDNKMNQRVNSSPITNPEQLSMNNLRISTENDTKDIENLKDIQKEKVSPNQSMMHENRESFDETGLSAYDILSPEKQGESSTTSELPSKFRRPINRPDFSANAFAQHGNNYEQPNRTGPGSGPYSEVDSYVEDGTYGQGYDTNSWAGGEQQYYDDQHQYQYDPNYYPVDGGQYDQYAPNAYDQNYGQGYDQYGYAQPPPGSEGYYSDQQYDQYGYEGSMQQPYSGYEGSFQTYQPGYNPNNSFGYAPSVTAPSIQGTEYSQVERMPRNKQEEEHEPISQASVDEFRQRSRSTSDPEIQLDFAKYLMEAAVNLIDEDPNPKARKKIRESFIQEALKIVKRLATQGMGLGKPAYPEAQFFLATCYGNGSLGLQVDHDKAFNLYNQAAKQNHAASTYRSAVCYEVGAGTKRDHGRAVQFYRKAAALGDTAAMYKLGMILLNGLLLQNKNPREAVTWLKRAAQNADEDNPHALHELGLAYEKATIPTIIPDEAYARELFTQAAQLNYPPSQFKLGCCYEYGTLTCPVDPRRSIAWYTRAAEKGDAESELALSGWYLTGSEGVLKQSDTEAYLWARKAADKGLAKAEYAVGYYSEVGIGVRQDIDEARRWYLRAAAQGNKRAMQRLTELKKLGSMRPKQGRPTRSQAKDECVVM